MRSATPAPARHPSATSRQLLGGLGQAVNQQRDPAAASDRAGHLDPARQRGDSVSTRGAAAATTIPIGTLTNSTHRHDA